MREVLGVVVAMQANGRPYVGMRRMSPMRISGIGTHYMAQQGLGVLGRNTWPKGD
jgi:hypothetical protein